MNDNTVFRQTTAVSAIISTPLALLSTFISSYAVGFNFDLLDEPVGLITLGARVAELFRWSWTLAAFGFYILLVPATLYLKRWLNSQKPNLVRMATLFGLGYCFIGGISLITMATVLSPLIRTYSNALGSQGDILVVVFQVISDLTFMGLGALAFIFGGVWWLGIGLELRAKRRVLGITTLVLGIATLGSGLGYLFHIKPLARLEMINYFLNPIWAAWVGIVILRRVEKGKLASKTQTSCS
ncbi:MAG: DUF4386 family protein [Anaerolineales bacterium]|jgi:hypothetical protein